MSEEKRTNIVLDDLDDVTGVVSGFRTIKSGSLINKQVIDHWDTVDEPHCMDCDAYMPPGPPCPNCGGGDAYTKTIETPVYKTVHHDAEYKTVHHDAEYTCSTCGAKW